MSCSLLFLVTKVLTLPPLQFSERLPLFVDDCVIDIFLSVCLYLRHSVCVRLCEYVCVMFVNMRICLSLLV